MSACSLAAACSVESMKQGGTGQVPPEAIPRLTFAQEKYSSPQTPSTGGFTITCERHPADETCVEKRSVLKLLAAADQKAGMRRSNDGRTTSWNTRSRIGAEASARITPGLYFGSTIDTFFNNKFE